MSSFPCLARSVSGSGEVRYALGHQLVGRYLESVAGRCRPNTLRAAAFDLKTFFTVVGKDPVEVTAVEVFEPHRGGHRGRLHRQRHPQPRGLGPHLEPAL
jgi:hypothetical protein